MICIDNCGYNSYYVEILSEIISPPEKEMTVSKNTTTHFTLDANHLPKASKTDLARLDAMRDEDIDYSDIPELTDTFWKYMRVLRPAPKKMLSLRIDSDLLAWFRAQGKGYQTEINTVLRAYVESKRNP